MNSFEVKADALAGLKRRNESEERRVCTECNKIKLINEFPGRVLFNSGKFWISYLNTCKKCNKTKTAISVNNYRKKNKYYSRLCGYRARSRQMGLKCDLKLQDVSALLNRPCRYCETKESKMTLDRINNNNGYTKDNVVPCCFRCNTLKADMPLEAWNHILLAIRSATKLGLFGQWRTEF